MNRYNFLFSVSLFQFFFLSCSGQICIVGSGYVGLTMAALLSKIERSIVCVDIDNKKIDMLNNKEVHIYEPDLSEMLFESPTSRYLTFSNDIAEFPDSEIYFLCVPTPPNKEGHCDCSFLFQAFDDILNNSSKKSRKIICVKSTVSPGTMAKLIKRLHETGRQDIDLAYNPEFMREGSALNDVLYRNPVVLASASEYALEKLDGIYTELLGSDRVNFIKTNFETAEVIKYAWNSFSAIRIAYVNELALLSRKFGADISSIVRGLALSEELLPTKKLTPGPGYGGSCLPKDTTGFSRIIEQEGFFDSMVHQAISSNKKHVDCLIDDICSQLKDSGEKSTVTLLGLSFKANTNDIRNAPSISIIRALLNQGVRVKAFDPKAMSEMEAIFPGVEYCGSPYAAVKDTDCIVVLTEWKEVKDLNLTKASNLCRHKKIIDTRNLFNTEVLHDLGFDYMNMGKL